MVRRSRATCCAISAARSGNRRMVQLPFRRPRDVRPFRDFFRAPLRFDSHRMALVFASRWIDHPLRSADAELHAALSAQAAAFEALASPDLPIQVRRVMRNLLLESKGSIETVARKFSMHRRTLDRHLDASGVSFRSARGRRPFRGCVPAAPRHADVRRRDRRESALRRRQRLRTRVPPLVGPDTDTVARNAEPRRAGIRGRRPACTPGAPLAGWDRELGGVP